MRKLLLVLVLCIPVSGLVHGQDADTSGTDSGGSWSAGLGADVNLNTREGVALGGSVSVDYGITARIAAGVTAVFSGNFGDIFTAEPAVFFRWYALQIGGMPLFAQGDIGCSIITEGADAMPAFLGAVRAGIRIPVKNFYVEPYVRFGFPFIWGIGALCGYSFNLKDKE
jgi:hypothetical protein